MKQALAVIRRRTFRDSMPYYRDLSSEVSGKVDIIAVLPQKEQEAQSFLQDSHVTVSKVVSADLRTRGHRDANDAACR